MLKLKRLPVYAGLLGVLAITFVASLNGTAYAQGGLDSDVVTAAEIESLNEEINWFAEMQKGGATMIFLAILSLAGLAFAIERLWVLRTSRFAPRELIDSVRDRVNVGDYDGALALCEGEPNLLAKAISFLVTHRSQSYETVSLAVGDIAGRSIRNQHTRTSPLAVVAALAPLLGLLGTMIGMIESFKLVSLYGDDGGASMLAGSIAKALITTAVGLIIAIPAVSAYHFFKQRIGAITNTIEDCIEPLMVTVLLDKPDAQASSEKSDK